MIIKNLYGRETKVNIYPYLVDWDRIVSKPQKKVKDAIRTFWIGCCICEEFKIPSSRLRVDLINFTTKIVVEVSPKGSHDFNKFFHKRKINLASSKKRDFCKKEWAEMIGFKYVEITDIDLKDEDIIINKIINDV